MPGETRFSGRMTILIVGFLFLIVATGMTMLAFHLYRSNGAPTALAASVVFAWAFASMLISMLLVLATSGKRVKGKVRARKGQVFVKLGDRSPASTAHVIGHGAEAEGEAGMRIVSRLPSVFLFASSMGLTVFGLSLFGRHRLDLVGCDLFIVVPIYIANSGRRAWPRTEREIAGQKRWPD